MFEHRKKVSFCHSERSECKKKTEGFFASLRMTAFLSFSAAPSSLSGSCLGLDRWPSKNLIQTGRTLSDRQFTFQCLAEAWCRRLARDRMESFFRMEPYFRHILPPPD